MKTMSIVLSGLMLSAVMLAAGGCSSNDTITSETFRKNPSPELYSYAAAKEQFQNDRALVVDQNMRLIQDDINSLLLLDQPFHTTLYAMP